MTGTDKQKEEGPELNEWISMMQKKRSGLKPVVPNAHKKADTKATSSYMSRSTSLNKDVSAGSVKDKIGVFGAKADEIIGARASLRSVSTPMSRKVSNSSADASADLDSVKTDEKLLTNAVANKTGLATESLKIDSQDKSAKAQESILEHLDEEISASSQAAKGGDEKEQISQLTEAQESSLAAEVDMNRDLPNLEVVSSEVIDSVPESRAPDTFKIKLPLNATDEAGSRIPIITLPGDKIIDRSASTSNSLHQMTTPLSSRDNTPNAMPEEWINASDLSSNMVAKPVVEGNPAQPLESSSPDMTEAEAQVKVEQRPKVGSLRRDSSRHEFIEISKEMDEADRLLLVGSERDSEDEHDDDEGEAQDRDTHLHIDESVELELDMGLAVTWNAAMLPNSINGSADVSRVASRTDVRK